MMNAADMQALAERFAVAAGHSVGMYKPTDSSNCGEGPPDNAIVEPDWKIGDVLYEYWSYDGATGVNRNLVLGKDDSGHMQVVEELDGKRLVRSPYVSWATELFHKTAKAALLRVCVALEDDGEALLVRAREIRAAIDAGEDLEAFVNTPITALQE